MTIPEARGRAIMPGGTRLGGAQETDAAGGGRQMSWGAKYSFRRIQKTDTVGFEKRYFMHFPGRLDLCFATLC